MEVKNFRNSMKVDLMKVVDPPTAVSMLANKRTENGVKFGHLSLGEQDIKISDLQTLLNNTFNEIAEKLQIEPDNLTAEKIHQLSSQIAADESISTLRDIYDHAYKELAEYRHIRKEPGYESDNPYDWPKSPFALALDLSFKDPGLEPGNN